ncbi:ABC transporter ATP-binding protein/permease [Mesorhizobium hawassense]|uniref:ABC transporter ATP-binding protein/permease n=1 Tax=Mesorhizobium hawassense TaxID=1209954 RepID=A0A330HPP0_9HYPH|nr:ribosome-associated ATPase/putative transporter RbbA [Mesorhizobium hawassense]RAZ90465.1 ABC transporter ATP-binding protein/permease [Mesorhizobium hawassense]
MLVSEAPAIDVSDVTHRYGAVTALKDVSVSVPVGAATAIVGPDGVGKSTLLGLIAGVRRLQSGAIRTLEGDIAKAAHRDAVSPRIAYMPQGLGRNLYPTLSVYENIDFFGRLFGLAASERHARIARLLAATGLEPFPDRPAGKLSGGMRQKLSLCCSLIHDPDLLILDEPTTGVDPLSRRQFWALIDEIRADRPGLTVLVSTAYMEEAELFDRLIVMDAGCVLADGSMADILARAGANTLEEAYVALQAGSEAGTRTAFHMPPRTARSDRPAIVAENLTRKFGDFTAVDGVSFSIEQGEVFGFLGSNGCGKTTTMKMLTGLLGITEGRAELLGRPVQAAELETRMRVGYMSQSFSLYEELTVRANLVLHARLYRIPAKELGPRVDEALQEFDLAAVADQQPMRLPLGVRQRLQLAAACLHHPEVLILDEPTSGVDPAARDMFWRILGDLSRHEGVTIFVSTHFMNEAERCDRVSLMHGGKLLAIGSPQQITASKGAATLEDAFIAYLQEADNEPSTDAAPRQPPVAAQPSTRRASGRLRASLGRTWAFARREVLELARDRIRLAFALVGPLILLVTLGYGTTFDVENLTFAVFDRDQSIESGRLVESFSSSRYFKEQPPLSSEAAIDRRLLAGELRVAIDIPPNFGRDLINGNKPEVAFFLDGANPFRAETARGYLQGVVMSYVEDLSLQTYGEVPDLTPLQVDTRFRYNQDFRSVFAITPGTIMLFLILFPAMLSALGVVREREVGSISNLYASPATVGEFLLGKQAPYILLGFSSFLSLVALDGLLFGVTVKGSPAALALGAFLYIFAATALGTLISSFVRTQIAAIIASAIITTVPAINFSGYLYPAATLEGAGRFMGMGFPSLWFQNVSLGAITKARDFAAFYREYLVLFAFGVGYLAVARLFLRKQEA